MLISTQQYGWYQYYRRVNQNFREHLSQIFATLRRAGVQAWEANLDGEAEIRQLKPLLSEYAIELPSVYTGGKLHEADWPQTVEKILRRASLAQECGATIVNINPDPKSWREELAKSDDELNMQAEALQTLGEKLAARGMRLAYHFHNNELAHSAREFHHTLLAVEESLLGLCMDVHWAYRGTGHSQLALLDILKLYGRRTAVLHLRQSRQGVWLERLDDGDVDYKPIAAFYQSIKFNGPAVLEIAYEPGTEINLSMEEAYRQSVNWVKSTFESQG
jgi:inosose dehydratase